jgi:pimeloyl-ACP methyl ester carboxylesterase
VVPLLMVHGWPGSVREFYEAVPLLTAPRPGYDFVFEVILPSLPGYGYSDVRYMIAFSVKGVHSYQVESCFLAL